MIASFSSFPAEKGLLSGNVRASYSPLSIDLCIAPPRRPLFFPSPLFVFFAAKAETRSSPFPSLLRCGRQVRAFFFPSCASAMTPRRHSCRVRRLSSLFLRRDGRAASTPRAFSLLFLFFQRQDRFETLAFLFSPAAATNHRLCLFFFLVARSRAVYRALPFFFPSVIRMCSTAASSSFFRALFEGGPPPSFSFVDRQMTPEGIAPFPPSTCSSPSKTFFFFLWLRAER